MAKTPEITIVARTETGWPVAKGEGDPAGKFYLRYYRGNRRYRYQGAFLTFFDALRAKKDAEQAKDLATLELADVHETLPIITVQESKPQYRWVPKTVQGARDITIDTELWKDLLELPEGLLFPLPTAMWMSI